MFDAAKFGMKTPTKILLAITAAAALSFAHPASANLITNPGFETGDLTGWTISPGGPFVTGTFNGIAPGPSLVLTFFFSTGPLLWFLDDVSVTPTGVGVPDAGSTLPLLGFALLGLVALRRRLTC